MKKYVLVILFSLVILFFFFNRGFAYYDEGFILHGAQRILQGEVVYRDFDFIYTPGSIFLLAVVFKLFGESIIVGRYLVLIVSALTSLLVFLMVKKNTNRLIASGLAVLLYLGWGPTHINFPWPSLLAVTAGLAAIWVLPNYFLVGLMTIATFLIKQNFGLAVFLTIVFAMGILSQMRKLKNVMHFVLGLLVGLMLFLSYLIFTGSLKSFLNNFYFYTVKSFLIGGVGLTPFPSGLKGSFYLLPGVISLLAIFVAYKRQKKSLVLPLFTFFFYIFGIRPTTDYPHLSILMAMTGIPLAIILGNTTTILDALRKSSLTRMTSFRLVQNLFNSVIYGSILLIISAGFYTALFKNYYRWDSPLVKQNYFIRDPKARILVDQKFAEMIPEVISEVKKNLKANDYIFIFPNAPMFYFLAERKNPTKYINMPLELHTVDQEKEVIENLKKKRVNIILTNEPPEDSNYPVISEFILKNYLKKKEIFEFTLWEKVESGKHSEVQRR